MQHRDISEEKQEKALQHSQKPTGAAFTSEGTVTTAADVPVHC